MKKLGLFILCALFTFGAVAQEKKEDSNWKKGGLVALTFSQTSLKNWAAGGNDAISANALLNLSANYKKDKVIWENTFNMEYGLMKQDKQSLRKSIDKLELNSKYGYQASEKWYYSALFNFKSQLAKGYEYSGDAKTKVSSILAPAYITLGLGMDYKPNDNFSAYVSPLTGKLTVVADEDLSNAGAFGVDPGDKTRFEFGALVKFAYKKEIMKNVNLKTELSFFTAYETFGNVDVNWDLMLNFKVNDYINATINTALIYDDDILTRVQFKEVVGIGLAYKF